MTKEVQLERQKIETFETEIKLLKSTINDHENEKHDLKL